MHESFAIFNVSMRWRCDEKFGLGVWGHLNTPNDAGSRNRRPGCRSLLGSGHEEGRGVGARRTVLAWWHTSHSFLLCCVVPRDAAEKRHREVAESAKGPVETSPGGRPCLITYRSPPDSRLCSPGCASQR